MLIDNVEEIIGRPLSLWELKYVEAFGEISSAEDLAWVMVKSATAVILLWFKNTLSIELSESEQKEVIRLYKLGLTPEQIKNKILSMRREKEQKKASSYSPTM